MFGVELYTAVRQLVFLDGLSRREVAQRLGISRDTVSKMCRYAAPPGYVRAKPIEHPKLGPFLGAIDAIVEADETAPVKQRHTAKRIWAPLPTLAPWRSALSARRLAKAAVYGRKPFG